VLEGGKPMKKSCDNCFWWGNFTETCNFLSDDGENGFRCLNNKDHSDWQPDYETLQFQLKAKDEQIDILKTAYKNIEEDNKKLIKHHSDKVQEMIQSFDSQLKAKDELIGKLKEALEEIEARCELKRCEDDTHYENYYESKQALNLIKEAENETKL
jgi:chromosome segregation ATPase